MELSIHFGCKERLVQGLNIKNLKKIILTYMLALSEVKYVKQKFTGQCVQQHKKRLTSTENALANIYKETPLSELTTAKDKLTVIYFSFLQGSANTQILGPK